MPNWTANRIHAEGEPADLRAFLEAVKWQDELFDFNRIIPMPEMLKHTGCGAQEIDGTKTDAWYIVRRWSPDEPEQPEQVRLFTPEEERELAALGHRDWYGWAVAHWGTKWNACRVDIDDSSIEYGSLEITFDTAWDTPVPVLREIVAMFPKLTFDCRWRHEDEDAYPHSLDDET